MLGASIDQLNHDKWAYAAAVHIDTRIDGFFNIEWCTLYRIFEMLKVCR